MKRQGCNWNSCVLESMLTELMEMTMQTNMEKSLNLLADWENL